MEVRPTLLVTGFFEGSSAYSCSRQGHDDLPVHPKMSRIRAPTKAHLRVFLFILLLANVEGSSSSSSSLECELYVAESTIPHAGLGVFTAVAKIPGDALGNGDPAFPLLELDFYSMKNMHRDIQSDHPENPFEDYVWDGITMGMGMEVKEGDTVNALWPGLDCVINSLIPLENVYRAFPQHTSHGDALPYMPHRAKHPAAGSITTYRSATTFVKREIPAGGELFKSYGDEWFQTRPWNFDKGFPLSNNFPHAQNIIENYAHRLNFPPLYDLMLDFRDIWKTSRTLNALPSNMDELEIALEKDITHIYQQNATRDLDWLQKHGTCVDHIISSSSTIEGAGEGAFAKRNLPKGTVITGSPVMVIPDENFLFMYEKEASQTRLKGSSAFTKQVVYNYCFGHDESTILLFPYGAIGIQYINHNPANANVRLQWTENAKLRHNSTLLELTPDEIAEYGLPPSLGIEYVATKDIMQGEELFIDYGSSWNDAWQHHVENWTPPEEDTISADWNGNAKEPIRTQAEQESNPYPKSIELRCHVKLLDPYWHFDDEGWKRYGTYDEEYLDVYGLPCTCLHRNADNTSYTVNISTDQLTFNPVFVGMNDEVDNRRTRVPREAMFFLDATYESDLYLESAFRHYIDIPDHMMPDAWKNRDLLKEAEHQNEEL